MQVVSIIKKKELTGEDLLIEEVVAQERIGTINAAIQGLALLAVTFLLCYGVFYVVVTVATSVN